MKIAKLIAKQDEKVIAIVMPVQVKSITDIKDFHPNKNK